VKHKERLKYDAEKQGFVDVEREQYGEAKDEDHGDTKEETTKEEPTEADVKEETPSDRDSDHDGGYEVPPGRDVEAAGVEDGVITPTGAEAHDGEGRSIRTEGRLQTSGEPRAPGADGGS